MRSANKANVAQTTPASSNTRNKMLSPVLTDRLTGVEINIAGGAHIGRTPYPNGINPGDLQTAFLGTRLAIIVPDRRISRSHAKIFLAKDGKYGIMDMASANGTFVNNRRLDAESGVELRVDDVIRVGDRELGFSFEEMPDRAAVLITGVEFDLLAPCRETEGIILALKKRGFENLTTIWTFGIPDIVGSVIKSLERFERMLADGSLFILYIAGTAINEDGLIRCAVDPFSAKVLFPHLENVRGSTVLVTEDTNGDSIPHEQTTALATRQTPVMLGLPEFSGDVRISVKDSVVRGATITLDLKPEFKSVSGEPVVWPYCCSGGRRH